ncbi:MAG: hypothetical protein M9894_38015 [Planctomycetes bacterium]|nr:hypothetical protein [Planctomycetota bacterium]
MRRPGPWPAVLALLTLAAPCRAQSGPDLPAEARPLARTSRTRLRGVLGGWRLQPALGGASVARFAGGRVVLGGSEVAALDATSRSTLFRTPLERVAAGGFDRALSLETCAAGRVVVALVGPVGSNRRELLAWDVDVRRRLDLPPLPAPPSAFAVSPDGRALALATLDGALHVVSLAPGGAGRTLIAPAARGDREVRRLPAQALAFAPDGGTLVVGAAELALLDVATGAVVGTLAGHAAPVTLVALAGDGRTCATADMTGSSELERKSLRDVSRAQTCDE